MFNKQYFSGTYFASTYFGPVKFSSGFPGKDLKTLDETQQELEKELSSASHENMTVFGGIERDVAEDFSTNTDDVTTNRDLGLQEIEDRINEKFKEFTTDEDIALLLAIIEATEPY